MTKTKRIAMILVIAILAIGAIGIATGTATQRAQGFCFEPTCDDIGHGKSFHDINGDKHSNGHA